MKSTEIIGVYKKNDKLFTENLASSKGIKAYNEKLVKIEGKEFRSWNPYRSKLAAAIHKGLNIADMSSDANVLYLGAATGTTVSHVSDIAKNGAVYAIESSPIAMKKLLEVVKKRGNVIPILADANHPDRYSHIVSSVNVLYQDISQRNQAELFIKNCERFLQKNGLGILMAKARSVDVSLKPKEVYETLSKELQKYGFKIIDIKELSPFEKDHAAFVVRW